MTIDVGKATPTITWANPAAISYGTALSGTQLNATASVPGTFVYTPASGAVLNAGTGQTLHVDLHADRQRELRDRVEGRGDRREQGHADDHLGEPGGD